MSATIRRYFRAPEIFIALTIIGLLALTITTALDQTQRSVRDTVRKEAISSFSTTVELFKSDFGVYPNYSMVLGAATSESGAKTGYDIVSTVTVCGQADMTAPEFVVGSGLVDEQLDLNSAYLKPGFRAVNQFLSCLNYGELLESDPLLAGTVADYQYRVAADYQTIVIAASLERLNDKALQSLGLQDVAKRYYLGNGMSNRALFDDTDYTVTDDKAYFQSLTGKIINNGRYLYQCLANADDRVLTVEERASKEFAPFTHDLTANSWLANPACKDSLESLQIVSAN